MQKNLPEIAGVKILSHLIGVLEENWAKITDIV